MRNQIFRLFLCPYCNKYTIHMPRLTKDGRWLVDHRLVEQAFYRDIMVTIPSSWCEINAVALTKSEYWTRTVIRV